MKNDRPIGIFDSGLGGLTIVRELRKRMPAENIVYFGDIARLPYGTKSREQILRYSIENTEFLLGHKVKAIIVACNSSSGAAHSELSARYKIPVLDVIQPAARKAAQVSTKGRVGVIATHATVSTGAYERVLKRLRADLQIVQKACPLFVPLVEEGWLRGKITREIAASYLAELRRKGIDTLILGCTHYPLLKAVIRDVLGAGVQLIDSAVPTADQLHETLETEGLRRESRRKGALHLYVSDKPRHFIGIGERFLREKIRHLELVRS